MIDWIRRYTSVLPREFGVLYGAANASLFWLAFFGAAYLAGLAFRLAAAAWLRHFSPGRHHRVHAQGALQAWLGGLRFRHVVQAYAVLMVAVLLLQRFADLTRYHAYLASRWATVAFAVWLAVQAPLLRFKAGSPAHAFVRWALLPLLGLLTALACKFGAYY